MMDVPLLISSLIKFADRYHGNTEIVTRTVEGPIHRYTYSEAHRRSKTLANALANLGVKKGDRIATLAWNTHRHLEIYYGVSGSGVICHTVNPRLFLEQIAYIINHAGDCCLFFDLTFSPIVEKLAPLLQHVNHYILMSDKSNLQKSNVPNLLCYEEILSQASTEFAWPDLDEKTDSSLCYTSGTTGNPKGVMYQHRTTILHSYAAAMPDALNLSARDVILPVVPMFHANAWGLPYAAALTGAKLVLPGAGMDGASLFELFEKEKVTLSAGVPTIWMGLVSHLKDKNLKFSTLKRTVIGGSAVPPAMTRSFEKDYNVEVIHAWGMTEMSPLGTVSSLKNKHLSLDREEQLAIKDKQGRAIFGVDLKIVDDNGVELPWDGKAFGELLVRGPWILNNYFRNEKNDSLRKDSDGLDWFPTGDVATIDPEGFMQITDRAKDVIKTGGEWISSIDLENTAVSHPDVIEAAVIAVYHPKWDERPLLIAVKKQGATVSKKELIEFFKDKVAKWWIPDDVVFVNELPHTATGKLQKNKLREEYANYKLPIS
ncbi:MAG: long-chain fatty acid--CoA ligase [Proteobacteria bacterium]|nr:long-chain fatty acid--CoA ligase [Pseudomonadota bacterium]